MVCNPESCDCWPLHIEARFTISLEPLKASPHRRRAGFRGFCRAFAFLLPGTAFCQTKAASEASSAHADRYQIVHVYPHDPSAYTPGPVYMEGRLYESTGLNGRSSVQMVDLAGGKVCSATIFLRNILEKV